jgi:hypothetical protein
MGFAKKKKLTKNRYTFHQELEVEPIIDIDFSKL